MAGLQLTLAPGWHTYWRAPGDAGIPPHFDWSGSENLSAVQVHWPTPEVFDLNGMRSIGYVDQIVLPIELTTTGTGPVHLRGQIDIGVCDEVCVPASLTIDTTLPADGPRSPNLAAALVDQPMTEAEAHVGPVTCQTEPTDDGLRLTTRISVPQMGDAETVVIEAGDPRVWVSEPTVNRNGDTLRATADLVQVDGDAFALNRSAVRITVLGSHSAVDIQGCTGG